MIAILIIFEELINCDYFANINGVMLLDNKNTAYYRWLHVKIVGIHIT